MRRVLLARRTISHLLSFHGYPPILEAVRSLLTLMHTSLETGLHQAHLQVQYQSEVSNWPPGDWGRGQESLRSDKKDANDPLADLPFRLEDFTDSLEPTEKHAPAHSSRESDLELLVEVAIKSRKHIIYSHSPKDRNCDVCLRTNKGSLQKTHWRSSASSRKVW